MHNLGDSYRELGRHEDGIAMKEKALDFRRRFLPENHPDIGSSCFSLGISYLQTGNLGHAVEKARESLRIWQATLPQSHPNIETALQLVSQIEKMMSSNP
jgi:hypothetical protein